jgi:tRNA U38,U39,U40 pseudouridine synthase TruA
MPYKLKPLVWEGKLDNSNQYNTYTSCLEARTVDFICIKIEFKADEFMRHDPKQLVVVIYQTETSYWETEHVVEPFETLEEGIEKAKALAEKLWYEYLLKEDYIERIN